MKIIKLTESDLTRIVEKVIKEQSDARMPFQPETLGYNPKKPETIKTSLENQKKLIAPFVSSLKGLLDAKQFTLPLHLRAFANYLLGREDAFTSKDLTKEEQDFLKSVAIPNAKKGLTYPLWKSIGADNLPTALTTSGSKKEMGKLSGQENKGSLLTPDLAGQFMYTLGEITPQNIKVSPDKSSVTIYDRYDMNTQDKLGSEVLNNFVNQLGSWWKGDSTFYSVVRNAASVRELMGYKGFPVNITL